jgi:List-Bact-rpt repeat protein
VPKSSVLVLTAEPAPGYRFTGWQGACTEATTSVCQVTMLDDGTSRALFEQIPDFTLSLTFAGSGSGGVSSQPAGLTCTATCGHGFEEGTVVQLTAAPQAGSVFTGWSGACSGAAGCTVTMDAARSVTATFKKQFTLTVGRGGTGSGAVTSAPAGIDCGTDCDEVYTDGTSVVLTAVPVTNSVFAGWSGGGCSGTGTCTVSMTAARSVSAVFTPLTYTLSVTKAGAGTGTISGTVPNVNCLPGSPCTVQVEHDQVVTLNASAGTSSRFTGWSGDCTGMGSCTVTMDQARSVTATFDQHFTLTVTRNGGGTGSVTSDPAGISCPSTCSAGYAPSTTVTLTASSAVGSTFTGWSGACSGADATCEVTMSQARTVTATFGITQHQLTIVVAGNGVGTVTSGGIYCPSMWCTRSYDHGTQVMLWTSVDTGTVFTGWSGGCSGQASTCVVTMDQARTVTATFSLATRASSS